MYSILLIIIYIAFISLGLPDSLLGSAWPVMYGQLDVPMSYAGIVTMIISGGTIISSLMSDRLTKKLGTGLVTAISVLLTAIALLGFSISNSFIMLCLCAIPYGFGAGAVDAALNNYVALHYASRHMSWLHCFWGVGAAISPYIMSYCLTGGLGWNSGYRSVGIMQIVLTAILFFSLPLWKTKTSNNQINNATSSSDNGEVLSLKKIVKIKGVTLVLFTFFGYCAVESTTGLWASSYLVLYKGVNAELAAKFASLFYLGITIGRFLCGFIADKFGDKKLIRVGIITVMVGILIMCIPINNNIFAISSLIIIGLGCAPIYPCVIHATPTNFGAENSQAIIGVQMASAYVGTTFMPPVFGWIADNISVGIYPLYLLVFTVIMLIMSEILNKVMSEKQRI